MNIEIKKFNELSALELYEILAIRAEVFVVEQECPYNDVDGKDIEATHVLIRNGKDILGYLRLLVPGQSYDDASIGRVVVTRNGRGRGVAKTLVQRAIDEITLNWKEDRITIGAQEYLKDFYSNLGFKAVSEVYLEDGIPHLDMTYTKLK